MAEYTLQDFMAARDAAAAAGDTEAVKRLSQEIDRLRQSVQQSVESPDTTMMGALGAITRGAAPVATGAALGAMAGAPVGGIGAIPGAATGAAIGGMATLVGDPVVQAVNSAFGTTYATPTEAMEYLLNRVGVAQPRSEAEKILQVVAAGGAGAGGIAGLGRAMQAAGSTPTVQAVGQQLAAQPLQQIAGGAAGAGTGELAGQAAGAMGAGPGLTTAAEIAGSVAGGAAGARAAGLRPQTAGTLPADIAEAERRGVRVMTTDVVPPRTFTGKVAQALSEQAPLGTGQARAAQQEERINAIRSMFDEFGMNDIAAQPDAIMKDLLAKRGADINKYSTIKNEVVERLAPAGTVQLPRTMQAIDNQIAELGRRRTEGADEAIRELQKIKTDLQGRDLFQVEAYRKDVLANVFKDDPARPMSLAARDAGEKALRAIYDPVRRDMGEFIKATGERRDFDKWKIANKRLENTAKELEVDALKSVLKKGEANAEAVNRLIFSKKPSEIRSLYRNLTPDGRAIVRSSILSKVAEESGGVQNISPERFLNSLERYGKSVGVFFKGEDLKNIEGLVRTLQLTRRAGEAGVAPKTGAQTVPIIAAALLGEQLGGVGGAIAAMSAGGLARIYESAPVRNAAAKVAQTVKGSPEEAAAAKRLLAAIEQQAGKETQQETR